MRLLCVNNVGASELEVGQYYNGVYACEKCRGGYILDEVRVISPKWLNYRFAKITVCVCGNEKPMEFDDRFKAYDKKRFVEIDDLQEIEEQEYSEQLENV